MSEVLPRGKLERFTPPTAVPKEIAEGFLQGTLSESGTLVHEGDNSRMWRCFERPMQMPDGKEAVFRVDYRQFQHHERQGERFDQMRFEYVSTTPDENGEYPVFAAMHWYIEKGETENPYPFDLMMVHRYVVPEYRDNKGVGTTLYQAAHAWAQQVANMKQSDLLLALSTDQPSTMDWAEKQNYSPFSEERAKRQEMFDHPERFTPVEETDSIGQVRNAALERKADGTRHRVWFQQILHPSKS